MESGLLASWLRSPSLYGISLAHSSAAHQLRSSNAPKMAQFFSEADEPLKARKAPAPRAKPRIPFAAIVGAVFGVAALGVLVGVVLYYRTRNGERKSRNLHLSQCDIRRTPPRRAARPVRRPLPCGCSQSPKGGGARSARGSPARPRRTRRTSRRHTRVRIRRTPSRTSRRWGRVQTMRSTILGVRLRFGRSRVVVTVPNRGSYCTFCSFGDG